MNATSASILARATARGLVAAMAMSGLRTFTANTGLLGQSPPEAIVDEHGPEELQQLTPATRTAVTELVHWLYGAGGGLAFGLLPARVRAHPGTGPLYGVTVWVGFELGIGPMLNVQGRAGGISGRLVLVLDHVMYGAVVAGRLAPEPEITRRRRRRGR